MSLIKQIQKQLNLFVRHSDKQKVPNQPHILPKILPNKIAVEKAPEAHQTFSHTYKTAYSHGLEAIYTLENVDIKSIRKLEQEPSQTLVKKNETITSSINYQLEFDFGDEYRNYMESFHLYVPIQTLRLSKYTENRLIEYGKLVLEDLLSIDIRDLVYLKGMGQGHIEEVKQKLQSYLDGRILYKTKTLDFAAFINSVIGSVDNKKSYLLLLPYQLSNQIPLTLQEKAEIRNLNEAQKTQWVIEGIEIIRKNKKTPLLQSKFHKLMNVFVKPWIRRRNGLATECEIIERLQRVSETPQITEPALKLLEHIFFDKQSIFDICFTKLDSDVYGIDKQICAAYYQVIQRAQSYFYMPSTNYRLDSLVEYLQREFAKEWICCENCFIEKALRVSPCFRIIKNEDGQQIVHLAGM